MESEIVSDRAASHLDRPRERAPQSGETGPADWKAMDDFAAGIDGNRLPATTTLAGTTWSVVEDTGTLKLTFTSATLLDWELASGIGSESYEAVEIKPGLYYVSVRWAQNPMAADVIVLDTGNGRSLRIRSQIADAPTPGRPRVDQQFTAGRIEGFDTHGEAPAPTRDLIGLRALYRYSPNHLYEHVYLSSERYAWQCLVGEQAGHGDVDLASTWKVADQVYVFTFREFIIPVAATWVYDFAAMRSTGTFLGLGADGTARTAPGGAFITKLGSVTYPDVQPV